MSRKHQGYERKMLNRPVSASELISIETPPINALFAPWLRLGERSLLYAWTGIGKTWLSLSVAISAAAGRSFLKWQNSDIYRTLYVDGEMSFSVVQERHLAIENAQAIQVVGNNLDYLVDDTFDAGLPNIADPALKDTWLAMTKDYDLVVFDNLLSLGWATNNRDSDVTVWKNSQALFKAMSRRGQAVLLVHHEGKSGSQLGTSTRTNDMDAVINLRRSPIRRAGKELCLEWHFDKLRHGKSVDEEPVYIWSEELPPLDDTPGGLLFEHEKLQDLHRDFAIEHARKGYKSKQIAEKLGVSAWVIDDYLDGFKDEWTQEENDLF